MAKISLLDLTVAQVEAIEDLSEVGFDRWTSPKVSKAAVFGAILVELGGVDAKEVGAMRIGDMVARVTELIDLSGTDGKAR